MDNDILSSLDPDSYERIYVCHICNGISTEPLCGNDHITEVSKLDFEHSNEPTTRDVNNSNKLVSKRKYNEKGKICAVIPRFANANFQSKSHLGYLCPVCGYLSPDVECKKSHDIKALKDICNKCGTVFESIEKMLQHDTFCSSPVEKYFADDSIMTIVPPCSTDQMLYNVVQPVALYLPENFASMVQKGSLGIGQYKVVAAIINTDRSNEENMHCSTFDTAQNISEWDETEDLAVLKVESSPFEILEDDESLKESKIGEPDSKPEQIESSGCHQMSSTTVISRKSMGQQLVENRRLLCCITCKMEFLDVDTLMAHYLSHGNSTFICQFCMRHYTKSHWFKVHMKSHVHELPIVCPLCDDSFLSTSLHEDHMKSVHQLSVPGIGRKLLDHQKNAFMCMECGRWLKSEKHLNSHRKMHDTVKGRTVHMKNQIMTLDQPILTDSTNSRASTGAVSTSTNSPKLGKRKPIHVFECNICLATIKSIDEVRQHMMSHDAHRLNKCEGCSKGFPTTAQLQQHKCIRYNENLNTCTDCSKVFSHPAGLSCHLQTDHQLETISCDNCQLKFKTLSTYLIHRAKYH